MERTHLKTLHGGLLVLRQLTLQRGAQLLLEHLLAGHVRADEFAQVEHLVLLRLHVV
jgi:hypothetical protein